MTAREMALKPDSPGTADMCASFHAFFGKDGLGAAEESLKSIGIFIEAGYAKNFRNNF